MAAHTLEHYVGWIIAACALAVCVLAWLRGGRAERGGATMVVLAWSAVVLVQAIVTSGAISLWFVSIPLLMIDFLLSFGLLMLALQYGSLWVGVAMLAQGAQLGLHAMFIAEGGRHHVSFAIGSNASSVVLLSALAIGTASSWRRRIDQGRPEGALAA